MFTFKVFRPTGVANQYKVVAHDGPRPLTASAVNTFAVNIAVQPGDVIGNNAANQAAVHNACTFEVLGENGFFFLNGDLADGASGNFLTAVDTRVNIAAGDDTPQTVIGGKKIKGTTAKFTFRSSVPGSSFQCKLDKHSYKSCSSPKKYKHLSSGKHKFKVRAVDAAGNADTTPAKKKFTI